MTNRNFITPGQVGQRYRVELARTCCSPSWWEYQVIDNATGVLVASGEVRGARKLALVDGLRQARKLEACGQPFFIPPIKNAYRIPC